jgi:calmodulin
VFFADRRVHFQSTPEFDEVLEAASVFDINGNGYISAEELRHVMKELGEGLDAATLDAMIKVAEADSEGQVRRF